MSGDRLTEDEISEVAVLIEAILPVAMILADSMTEDRVLLLERAMKEASADQSHMDAASVAYMAMGVDVERDPAIQKAKRTMPVIEQVLKLREALIVARESEVEFEERREARENFQRAFRGTM